MVTLRSSLHNTSQNLRLDPGRFLRTTISTTDASSPVQQQMSPFPVATNVPKTVGERPKEGKRLVRSKQTGQVWRRAADDAGAQFDHTK